MIAPGSACIPQREIKVEDYDSSPIVTDYGRLSVDDGGTPRPIPDTRQAPPSPHPHQNLENADASAHDSSRRDEGVDCSGLAPRPRAMPTPAIGLSAAQDASGDGWVEQFHNDFSICSSVRGD